MLVAVQLMKSLPNSLYKALLKRLQAREDTDRICNIIALLGQDFATSTNVNHRKGGLIALAGVSIGLMGGTKVTE